MKYTNFYEMPNEDCICEYKNCKQEATHYLDKDILDSEGSPLYKEVCLHHAEILINK